MAKKRKSLFRQSEDIDQEKALELNHACDAPLIVDKEKGQVICSKCGLVIEERVPYSNVSSSIDIEKKRVHAEVMVDKYGLEELRNVKPVSGMNPDLKRALKFDSQKDYFKKLLYVELIELRRFSLSLNIPPHISQTAFSYFKKLIEIKSRNLESVHGHLYSCVYLACTELGFPLTLEEILDNSKDSRLDLRQLKTCRKITAEIIGITNYQSDYDVLISTVCNQLKIAPKIAQDAIDLFNKYSFEKSSLIAGRNPRGICAAIIYLLSRESYGITQRILAGAFDITELTIRNNYPEVVHFYDSLKLQAISPKTSRIMMVNYDRKISVEQKIDKLKREKEYMTNVLNRSSSEESKVEYMDLLKNYDKFIKFFETVRSYTEDQMLKEFKYPFIEEELKQLSAEGIDEKTVDPSSFSSEQVEEEIVEKEPIKTSLNKGIQVTDIVNVVRTSMDPLKNLSLSDQTVFKKTNLFLSFIQNKAQLSSSDIADLKAIIENILQCSSLPQKNRKALEDLLCQSVFLQEVPKAQSSEKIVERVASINADPVIKPQIDLCSLDFSGSSDKKVSFQSSSSCAITDSLKKEIKKDVVELLQDLKGKTSYVKTTEGLKTVRQILKLDAEETNASNLPNNVKLNSEYNANAQNLANNVRFDSVNNINLKPEFSKMLYKVTTLKNRYKTQPELLELKSRLIGSQAYYPLKYSMDEIQSANNQLDDSEKIRFKNQLKNTIINQQKIKNAKIAVLGCGGIGSNALIGLSFFGIYNYKLVDFDTINLSNLNEQTLYNTPDVGKLKVFQAAERLVQINPIIRNRVEAFNMKIDYPKELNILEIDESLYPPDIKKIDEIIKWSDYVVAALDLCGAPYLINDLCVKNRKPYYWGVANYFLGDMYCYSASKKTPCFRCIHNSKDISDVGGFMRYHVGEESYKAINFVSTNAVIGIFIAECIVKDICGIENINHGCYVTYDGYDMRLYSVPVHQDVDCKCQKYHTFYK